MSTSDSVLAMKDGVARSALRRHSLSPTSLFSHILPMPMTLPLLLLPPVNTIRTAHRRSLWLSPPVAAVSSQTFTPSEPMLPPVNQTWSLSVKRGWMTLLLTARFLYLITTPLDGTEIVTVVESFSTWRSVSPLSLSYATQRLNSSLLRSLWGMVPLVSDLLPPSLIWSQSNWAWTIPWIP